MTYNFDQEISRTKTGSIKWDWFGDDVLPMWVADMDFQAPPQVLNALQSHVTHGIFGYGVPQKALSETICARMADQYNWQVTPEQIVFLPGLVCGVNLVCRAYGEPSSGVLVQTPIYPPFLSAPSNQGQVLQTADLALVDKGATIGYEIDFAAFEAAITKQTKLFILCHPHNPTGVSYSVDDLTRMAEICARHGVIICSDEIHCDLLLDGTSHVPMAAVSPEISQNCITLMAPSKTFNIPGLGCSFAIVQNPDLLTQLNQARDGIVPWVNVLGLTAAQAAYDECDPWLADLRDYLTANRNFLTSYITEKLPSLRPTHPNATYLTWIDCRQSGIEDNPHKFFLEHGKVALNDGTAFGKAGEGFVRLNFGCPRSQLEEALDRMQTALKIV
ncbi:PatB family C-S lyase [Anaerolineales bacterium HSG25]|nr:PatB family C-S lyase [Anaerolineales bacterium HSG25]